MRIGELIRQRRVLGLFRPRESVLDRFAKRKFLDALSCEIRIEIATGDAPQLLAVAQIVRYRKTRPPAT